MKKPHHLPPNAKSKYHCRMVKSLLAVGVLLLVGCKSSPSFVGKWTSESDLSGITIKTTTENKADGTFTSNSTGSTGTGTTMDASELGTWKLEGDKLRIIYADINWSFRGGKPELVKRANDRFKENKPNVLAEANRVGALPFVWKGGDEFTVTSKDGKSYTYRRLK